MKKLAVQLFAQAYFQGPYQWFFSSVGENYAGNGPAVPIVGTGSVKVFAITDDADGAKVLFISKERHGVNLGPGLYPDLWTLLSGSLQQIIFPVAAALVVDIPLILEVFDGSEFTGMRHEIPSCDSALAKKVTQNQIGSMHLRAGPSYRPDAYCLVRGRRRRGTGKKTKTIKMFAGQRVPDTRSLEIDTIDFLEHHHGDDDDA